jgi:phosphatidylglycerophosphate synthase
MEEKTFTGDRKVGKSILSGPENRLKEFVVPRLPSRIETHHLTLMTLVWTGINFFLAFRAGKNPGALWGVSLMIACQYLTDLFDGALGRARNTGLVRWGFYMDHFLDYGFLYSLVFVGYRIAPPGLETWFFLLAAILGGFMVNSFLSFGATGEFEICHFGIGPTETRLVLIGINTFIVFFGTGWFPVLVPFAFFACLLALAHNVFSIQKKLWMLDMQMKDCAGQSASRGGKKIS